MKKRLKVKNDFIFQRIFGRPENKDILISLLNAILNFEEGKNIDDLQIVENKNLDKDRIEDKQGILDIRAKLVDGTQINIEMQLVNQFNMDKRTLFYWSKLFAEQLKSGESFDSLNKTITINILDFDYLSLDKYHTTFHLREDEHTDYKLTDVMEIHFIELSKFRKNTPDIEKPLERWLLYMETSSEEVLEVLKDRDPSIKKAEEILDWLGTDEETVREYQRREMQIHDEVTRIAGARKEGIEEGIKEGIKEGIMHIAKKMLLGNINIPTIKDITGLTDEELEHIKKQLH